MSQVKVVFSGGVVADPETKQVGSNTILEFPVYVNHRRKNAQGEYENSGDTTKIRVSLWRDLASADIRKGDIVEVDGTLVEKEWTKQDGTTGRALQTEFVNSIDVKFRKDEGGATAAPKARGFEDLPIE
jgi:single-stranded DNA-binding protein